jgi:hypothetical protein
MSWKGGSGCIGVGVRELVFHSTGSDNTQGVVLCAGQSVLVIDTDFKLVRSN